MLTSASREGAKGRLPVLHCDLQTTRGRKIVRLPATAVDSANCNRPPYRHRPRSLAGRVPDWRESVKATHSWASGVAGEQNAPTNLVAGPAGVLHVLPIVQKTYLTLAFRIPPLAG